MATTIPSLADAARLSESLRHGAAASPETLAALVSAWETLVTPLPGESETLLVVDASGQPYDPRLFAPRWLCHLLGLRHRCAHVLVRWASPAMGSVYVLQLRNWDKLDSPGHLDISVGGHVKGLAAPEQAAYEEMEEELGIRRADLQGVELRYCGGYDSYAEQGSDFRNAEWHDVFVADIRSLDMLRFADGEVAGAYLCPAGGAESLLTQSRIPLAGSLAQSLRLVKEQPSSP